MLISQQMKQLLEEKEDKAISALKDGMTPAIVSETYGFNMGTVRDWIKRYKILQSRKLTHNQALRMIDRYNDGGDAASIAGSAGISKEYMYEIFKKFGFKSRKQGRNKTKNE